MEDILEEALKERMEDLRGYNRTEKSLLQYWGEQNMIGITYYPISTNGHTLVTSLKVTIRHNYYREHMRFLADKTATFTVTTDDSAYSMNIEDQLLYKLLNSLYESLSRSEHDPEFELHLGVSLNRKEIMRGEA